MDFVKLFSRQVELDLRRCPITRPRSAHEGNLRISTQFFGVHPKIPKKKLGYFGVFLGLLQKSGVFWGLPQKSGVFWGTPHFFLFGGQTFFIPDNWGESQEIGVFLGYPKKLGCTPEIWGDTSHGSEKSHDTIIKRLYRSP